MKLDQGFLGVGLGQMISADYWQNNARDLRVAYDFSKLNFVHVRITVLREEGWDGLRRRRLE